MNKRRERVEKWRLEQKMKLAASKTTDSDDEGKPRKVWSLEDDDEDDDDDDNGRFYYVKR